MHAGCPPSAPPAPSPAWGLPRGAGTSCRVGGWWCMQGVEGFYCKILERFDLGETSRNWGAASSAQGVQGCCFCIFFLGCWVPGPSAWFAVGARTGAQPGGRCRGTGCPEPLTAPSGLGTPGSKGSPAAWGLLCTAAQPSVKWAEKKRKASSPAVAAAPRHGCGVGLAAAGALVLPSRPSFCFQRFANRFRAPGWAQDAAPGLGGHRQPVSGGSLGRPSPGGEQERGEAQS